jgi:hypothetical protein
MNESNGHKYEHSTDRQLQHSSAGSPKWDIERANRLAKKATAANRAKSDFLARRIC